MSRIKPGLISYENRVVLLATIAALPGSACALFLFWAGSHEVLTQDSTNARLVIWCVVCVLALRERVVFSLQTLSNLLGALREGDFSVRGRSYRDDDALG